MKHASAQALESLASLLERIRSLGHLKERRPGIFYLGSSAFLHFHEDLEGLFADAKLDLQDFKRFAINTKVEQDRLVQEVAAALAAVKWSKEGARMVTDAELSATVNRMELRLASVKSPSVKRLMSHYSELVKTFESDLAGSKRDVALAKASALMLVQAVANAKNVA
jgi:hypothetical protein